MSKKRIVVPTTLASRVLFDFDRTCCVCRKERQRVQIHHIDDNPSNNKYENLAVLCFDCHWETQISGGFDRKLDANQINLYKEDWVENVKEKRAVVSQESRDGSNEEGLEKQRSGYSSSTPQSEYIEFRVAQESIASHSHGDVLKKSALVIFACLVFLSILISIIWIWFSSSEPLLPLAVAFLSWLPALYVRKNRIYIKMLLLPQVEGIDQCLQGIYVHKGADGNYTSYEKRAMCSFPKCEGEVVVEEAPPRERHKYGVVGRCKLEPNLHTYTVDFNGIGYFKEFDFRSLESPSQ